MKIIFSSDAAVDWLAARIGMPVTLPASAIGLAIDNEIKGAVVFTNWTGHDIEVMVAGEPRVWTRAFLRRIADYVWNELGCIRCTFKTQNPMAANCVLRLGGKVEGVQRDFYGPGAHATVLGIRRSDWRI